MWAGLPVNKETFRPIDLIANRRDISGSSNLFAVTANYRFRLQGKTFGWYWIGGGGAHYRHASLFQGVEFGTGPAWRASWVVVGINSRHGIRTREHNL